MAIYLTRPEKVTAWKWDGKESTLNEIKKEFGHVYTFHVDEIHEILWWEHRYGTDECEIGEYIVYEDGDLVTETREWFIYNFLNEDGSEITE